ncbi:MAG TPA: EVE domain-containing protein [Reyranella sp.]|nr:EVE domain-containing protein [Reyranella sp.]
MTQPMNRNWLAVASADHVAIGRAGGFMQVCHGKGEPLRRIQPGDRVVYYSPSERYSPSHAARERDRLQAFTAIGTVREGKPYRDDRADGFPPYRRDVDWHDACAVPLALVRDRLAFMREANWGYRLRQGLVELSDADMATIAEAMFTDAERLDRLAA